jgi:VIT1/CCC1 family predicted Fe2+/Mn2+ transporter
MNEQNTNIANELSKRALQVQRGGARAAVLGVNDGLVSTLCLVVGMAAAGATNHIVLTAGLAGLLAGAISMAAGEWISVRSQVELFEGVLGDSKQLMAREPDYLKHQLSHKLAHLGMVHETAHSVVEDVAQNDDNFLALYSAQVIGINANELGSPWRAAVLSFVLFTVGSLVPLASWFVVGGHKAVIVSIIATALAGLCVGGFIAKLSGRRIFYGATRQLLIILGSAATTYGIGLLFGVAIH